MKFGTILAVGGIAGLWYVVFRARPYSPCHICGQSRLVCEACEECKKVACASHAPLYRVCQSCYQVVQEGVRTSTTGTIAGFRVSAVVGVVAGSAGEQRTALYRLQSQAHRMGANGVVDVKIQPISTGRDFVGYAVQGTAVKLEPDGQPAPAAA